MGDKCLRWDNTSKLNAVRVIGDKNLLLVHPKSQKCPIIQSCRKYFLFQERKISIILSKVHGKSILLNPKQFQTNKSDLI